MNTMDATGLLLSGGLDSSILLGHLLRSGKRVQPFYVQSQLAWQGPELVQLRRFLKALAGPAPEPLVVLDLPLTDLYGNHWAVNGVGAPDETSPDEAVYLPGRNALLAVKALLWCQLQGIAELAIGVLGTSPFADAKPDFFSLFESALARGTGSRVRLLYPFAKSSKREVMELGRGLPLEFTFSCIAPHDDLHCGSCNKCAERRAAFASVGLADPTQYAIAARQC